MLHGNGLPADISAIPSKPERLPVVDFVRGFAVLMMIAYHTAYFLDYHGLADVPLYESDFWYYAPRVIVAVFLGCSGASLYLSCRSGIRFGRYLRRVGLLALLAGLITLGTRILFPERFVFCGILHCAAGSSVLVLPFLLKPIVRRPWIPLLAGFALIVLSRLGILPDLPPKIPGVASMDYIPLLPWVAAVCIGVFLGYLTVLVFPLHIRRGRRFFENPVIKIIRFLGKYSLWVYFIHIALIFGATMAFAALIG